MQFHEAAEAYELITSGLSYRKVAPLFGVSRETLRMVILGCLADGRESERLTHQRGGMPHFSQAQMMQAIRMHANGMAWKCIGREMVVDAEKLRRACQWFGDPGNVGRQRQRRLPPAE